MEMVVSFLQVQRKEDENWLFHCLREACHEDHLMWDAWEGDRIGRYGPIQCHWLPNIFIVLFFAPWAWNSKICKCVHDRQCMNMMWYQKVSVSQGMANCCNSWGIAISSSNPHISSIYFLIPVGALGSIPYGYKLSSFSWQAFMEATTALCPSSSHQMRVKKERTKKNSLLKPDQQARRFMMFRSHCCFSDLHLQCGTVIIIRSCLRSELTCCVAFC